MKRKLKPTTALYPLPVVLVTSAHAGRHNVMTVAWAATVASEPPAIAVGVRPGRHSFPLIRESGEFVVNLPGSDLLRQADLCGVLSGRDADKFEAAGLTPVPADVVGAPLIEECPVNIECRVIHHAECGSHTVFIGEVVAVHADEGVLDGRKVDFEKLKPFVYFNSSYLAVGGMLGTHGFSAARREG